MGLNDIVSFVRGASGRRKAFRSQLVLNRCRLEQERSASGSSSDDGAGRPETTET